MIKYPVNHINFLIFYLNLAGKFREEPQSKNI